MPRLLLGLVVFGFLVIAPDEIIFDKLFGSNGVFSSIRPTMPQRPSAETTSAAATVAPATMPDHSGATAAPAAPVSSGKSSALPVALAARAAAAGAAAATVGAVASTTTAAVVATTLPSAGSAEAVQRPAKPQRLKPHGASLMGQMGRNTGVMLLPQPEKPKDVLTQLGKRYKSEAPIHRFTSYYDGLFQSQRDSVRRFLQVGVHRGGTMKMWRDFFPGSAIFGLDSFRARPAQSSSLSAGAAKARLQIEPDRDAKGRATNFLPQDAKAKFGERVQLIDANQSDAAEMAHVTRRDQPLGSAPIDIIIEDGSHMQKDQLLNCRLELAIDSSRSIPRAAFSHEPLRLSPSGSVLSSREARRSVRDRRHCEQLPQGVRRGKFN